MQGGRSGAGRRRALRALQLTRAAQLFAAVGEPFCRACATSVAPKRLASSPVRRLRCRSPGSHPLARDGGGGASEVLALGRRSRSYGHDVTPTAGMTQEQVIAAINAVSREPVIARATGRWHRQRPLSHPGAQHGPPAWSGRLQPLLTADDAVNWLSGIGTLFASDLQPAGEGERHRADRRQRGGHHQR